MVNIAVIDYGLGNLHSACRGLTWAGAVPRLVTHPDEILDADAMVLPGVGSFDPAMAELRQRHWIEPLRQAVQTRPILGICLGLQLLFEGSDEGNEAGLGLLPGRVRRLVAEPGLTIPQMGWNTLDLTQPDSPLWVDLPRPAWVYFVHSYHAIPGELGVLAATTTHGSQRVTAAVAQGMVFGTQFHPEKSGQVGLGILRNFVTWVAASMPTPVV